MDKISKEEAKALINLLRKAGKTVGVYNGYIVVSDSCLEEAMNIDIRHLAGFKENTGTKADRFHQIF